MRFALTVALLVTAVGALAQAPSAVNDRAEHWRQKVAQEMPIGSLRQTVIEWASRNKLRVRERPKERELVIRLETLSVPATDTVCAHYQIRASVKFDVGENLESVLVEGVEDCIF